MVDYEEEIKKRTQMVYVPNWFSVDIKTGVSNVDLHLCFFRLLVFLSIAIS